MNFTTVAIIYNPNSTGSSKTLAKNFKIDLQKTLPSQKMELIATKYAGHAESLAYDIAMTSKRPLIISSSGDGGYNEVVNGAMKAQLKGATPITGILPAGNANDHYHNLHNNDLVQIIAQNRTRQIDLLKIEATSEGKKIERYAHSYIGFGLTPSVGKELNKAKLNIINEALLVVRALFRAKAVPLIINGKKHYYDSIIFSNIDQMSKYLKISQPSHVDDGKFEVTIFRRHNKLKLISLLMKASLVGVNEDKQISKFSFMTVKKTLVQTDGEILTIDSDTDAIISIEKRMLKCIV